MIEHRLLESTVVWCIQPKEEWMKRCRNNCPIVEGPDLKIEGVTRYIFTCYFYRNLTFFIDVVRCDATSDDILTVSKNL